MTSNTAGVENIVRGTLAANVADSGTLTVAYPTGVSKGSFVNSPGHHVLRPRLCSSGQQQPRFLKCPHG